jgi:flagellum-specific ATP synthase
VFGVSAVPKPILESLLSKITELPTRYVFGRVVGVIGMMVEVAGIHGELSIGGRCSILARDGRRVVAEVVGFRAGRALLMPFGTLDGVALGCKAEITPSAAAVAPCSTRWARPLMARVRCSADQSPIRCVIHRRPPIHASA